MFRSNAKIIENMLKVIKVIESYAKVGFNVSHFTMEDPVCTATCLALLYKMATRTTIHTTNAFVEGGKRAKSRK